MSQDKLTIEVTGPNLTSLEGLAQELGMSLADALWFCVKIELERTPLKSKAARRAEREKAIRSLAKARPLEDKVCFALDRHFGVR